MGWIEIDHDATVNARYKNTGGTASVCLPRMYAYNSRYFVCKTRTLNQGVYACTKYMLISGISITGVVCLYIDPGC